MATSPTLSIFEALPGIPMPVGEVAPSLAQMWQPESAEMAADGRATQMNLITHFGADTSVEEAQACFQTAVQFAQRHPCRIVVLCPVAASSGAELLEGKLFSECYIGAGHRARCCCEALMLGYPADGTGFLENQVSIWLDNDLPVYLWLHRVPANEVSECYLPLVERARRTVFDRNVEDEAFCSAVSWPEGKQVRDLSWARLLPVRQSLGQFLSAYSPESLVDGLREVAIRYTGNRGGEARNLIEWFRQRIAGCRREAGLEATPEVVFTATEASSTENRLEVSWTFGAPEKFLKWAHQGEQDHACLTADFGRGKVAISAQIRKLQPASALSEALFF